MSRSSFQGITVSDLILNINRPEPFLKAKEENNSVNVTRTIFLFGETFFVRITIRVPNVEFIESHSLSVPWHTTSRLMLLICDLCEELQKSEHRRISHNHTNA
jgi:hypothetical protein